MKVLVALDPSPYAARIIDAIAARMWPKDTQFYLVTVVEESTGWFSTAEYVTKEAAREANSRAQVYIEDLALRLKKRLPTHTIYGDVFHGSASDQIVHGAADLDVDLIVLGQQGQAAAGGLSLGGVAEKVVQKAHCSVEVVKPKVTVSPLSAEATLNETYVV